MRIAFHKAHVIDPFTTEDRVRDLFVENGLIVEQLSAEAERVIDASNYVLMPGLIDAHTHLREPGFEYKEDIISASKAAAHGGYVAVAAMPNTNPVCDNAVVVSFLKDKAAHQAYCDILPVGAATKGSQGEVLAEIGLMQEAGAVAISDDGHCVSTADMLTKVLQYAYHFGLPVIDHCEERSLSAKGAMNEGIVATELGLRGIPTTAESIIVARDLLLAEYLNLPIHLCHLSAKSSIELVRQAKARGVKVTCDTCPHYFLLTEESCRSFDTNYKMYPPLRTEEDRQAIIAGLIDGTIDLIATDHAPHHNDEKDLEFALASNGIIGLETAFALSYTELCLKQGLSLHELVAKFTLEPAKLFKLKSRALTPGNSADLVLFDLDKEYVIDWQDLLSKAHNTPFVGTTVKGKTMLTLWKGRLTYEA